MKPVINRFPIRLKIVGIAGIMLFLLILMSIITLFSVSVVRGDMMEIAETLVPISNTIARINSHKLEQAIHRERMRRLSLAESPRPDLVDKERLKIEHRSNLVSEEITAARGLALGALEKSSSKQDIITFTRLDLLLQDLQVKHQSIPRLTLQGVNGGQGVAQAQLWKEKQVSDRRLETIQRLIAEHAEESAMAAGSYEKKTQRLNWVLTLLAGVIGLTLAAITTIGLVRPLTDLVKGTDDVSNGHLNVRVEISSQDEFAELSNSFNEMVHEVGEKQRIKAIFGQFLDPRIVETMIQQSAGMEEKGIRQEMTVFFSDIAGFSAISEMLTPIGLVNLINEYLTLAAEPILKQQGVIDKYVGDAVIAFWGPPYAPADEHAKLGCFAALEQFTQLEHLRKLMPELMNLKKGLPEVNIRVGIATGEMLAGNIGSEHSRAYTVIGAAAELGERLEEMGKIYGTQILISEETQRQAADAIEARELDFIRVEGRDAPQRVYELQSRKRELDPTVMEMSQVYGEGLAAYRSQDWDEARARFEACLQLVPDDSPSTLMLKRVAVLGEKFSGEGWDGVWPEEDN